jgi:hypothetical protein
MRAGLPACFRYRRGPPQSKWHWDPYIPRRGERRHLHRLPRIRCWRKPSRAAPQRGHWLWSDGNLAVLTATIEKGVAEPKQYQGVMPLLGGAPLSQQDVAAVSAYVWRSAIRIKTDLLLIFICDGRFALAVIIAVPFGPELHVEQHVLRTSW